MRRSLASLLTLVILAGVVRLEVGAAVTDGCCECCDDEKAPPTSDHDGADCGGEGASPCSCCAQLHVLVSPLSDGDVVVLAPSRSETALAETDLPDAPPREILHVPRARVA